MGVIVIDVDSLDSVVVLGDGPSFVGVDGLSWLFLLGRMGLLFITGFVDGLSSLTFVWDCYHGYLFLRKIFFIPSLPPFNYLVLLSHHIQQK